MTAKTHGLRFHLAGGLVFERVTGESGEDVIEIGLVEGNDPLNRAAPYRKVAVTSISGFASVVAFLSYDGETHESHRTAEAFLDGANVVVLPSFTADVGDLPEPP